MNPSCSVGTVNLWERKVLNKVWKIIHLHMIWLKIDFKMLLASYFDNFVLISVVCPCSGEIMNVLFSVDDSLINEMIQSSSILCLCRSKKWARAKLSPLAGFQTLRSGRRLSAVRQRWHEEGSIFSIDKDYFCQEQHSWAYLKNHANKCPSLWLSITTLPSNKVPTTLSLKWSKQARLAGRCMSIRGNR